MKKFVIVLILLLVPAIVVATDEKSIVWCDPMVAPIRGNLYNEIASILKDNGYILMCHSEPPLGLRFDDEKRIVWCDPIVTACRV